MKSHALFAAMPRSVAEDILEYSHSQEKALYRATLEAVANARKVRPVYLERQPRAERMNAMIGSLGRPALELAADGLLRNWLLKKHAKLLVDFMDALKIPHEKGVVNDLPGSVNDADLRNAIETILAQHPAEAVTVYLHAFNGLNGEHWENLETALRTDPRLQWPAPAAASA